MTIDGETDGSDFAAFEAAANADPAEQPEEQTQADATETPEDGDTPEVNDEADDDGEDGDDKPEKKPRQKTASQRIAEITARLRQAERERDEARQGKQEQQPEATATAEKPNPADFEYGEADPGYIDALTDWKVDQRFKQREERETARAEEERQKAAAEELDTRWNEQVAKGTEKYEDFDEVVVQAAANQEWMCPPLVAAAITQSPVGADVAYHLATNPTEAAAIAAQLQVNPMQAAERFGFLEGGFLDDMPEAPGPNAHPLDMAIYAGRLRALVDKGATGKKDEGKQPKVTNAPEPPRHNVRGGSGKFTVGADTNDFAAFERMANGRR